MSGPPFVGAEARDAIATLARGELEKLHVWERFHIRLAMLYGGTVFIVLTLLMVATSTLVVRSEMRGLQRRILSAARVTAIGLDADVLAAAAKETSSPVRAEVGETLGQVLESTPGLESVYILMVTEQYGQLAFFADRSRSSRQAEIGELYDATEVPTLLAGLVKPTVETEPVTDSFGSTLSGYAPLVSREGRTVGLVGVDVDAADVAAMRAEIRNLAITIYLVTLLLLGLVTWLVSRLLREPLVQMIASSAAIARGIFSTRLHMLRRDEFGVLGRHFDQMAEGLEEREFIRATFGRYMSENVARALLANPGALEPGGEEREVTILFSDLRGYSTIAEHLAPSQVVALLNDYLAAMNVVIDAQGGCVIEFLGDAILAVFGAPVDVPGHPERAVRCALAMSEALARQNATWEQNGFARVWKDRGLPNLAQRVGIHTGRVVAGNLGSSERMKYAVIGDAVNVAARLEALNKDLGTDLLMSDAVFSELPDDLAARCVRRGEHRVKGRDRPVEAWSIASQPSDAMATPAGKGEKDQAPGSSLKPRMA